MDNQHGAGAEKDEVRPLPIKNPSNLKLGNVRAHFTRALTSTSLFSIFTSATAVDNEGQLKPSISHPLAGLSRKQLFDKVEELAEAHNLIEHLEILRKGALLAQMGEDWEKVTSLLDSDEIEATQLVKRSPWRQITPALILTVAAASFGALTLGWDQGVLSGATLHYPSELGIDPDADGPNRTYYNWLTGVISAGPFMGAAGFAVWFSDVLNKYLGRRGALAVAAVFLFATPLASAFVQTWGQLLACRLLLGVGIGLLEVTAPVFSAESAPQEIRGAMTINFQLFTALGIFLGSSVNLGFEKAVHNWRLMLASPMVPVPILAVLLVFCPESARWYLKKNRIHDAFHSLLRLRHHPILAARDLYLIHVQIVEEQNAIGGARNVQRFAELFYKTRIRQATLASCIVHLAQVLCGINIVCLFSATIFIELTKHGEPGVSSTTALAAQVASSQLRALWGSWGFGLINFLFTFPALWSIDRLGRRTLMLLTLPNLFWTLLVVGLCFLINGHSKSVELGLVLAFVYIYTACYSVGMGPIAFCYSAEAAAQTHRELSVALAAFVNNAANTILSISFFRMRQSFGTVGVFIFYACLNILTFMLVFAFVPETKQLSLEELDSVFAHPNREFVKYQLTQNVPYTVKKYILQQKGLKLPSLDEIHHIDHL